MSFEHYRIKYRETSRTIYYLSSLGYFEKFDKVKHPDCKIYENRLNKVEGHISKGVLRTYIVSKWVTNRVEVYKYFGKDYRKGRYVMQINSNLWDCNIENLRQVKMGVINQKHSRKRGVIYTRESGERCVRDSISALSRELYISRSSIVRYLQGKTKSRYLNELKVEYLHT